MKIIDGTDMTSKKFIYMGLKLGFFVAATIMVVWFIVTYFNLFFYKILPILFWIFCGIIVVWIIIGALLDIFLGFIGESRDVNKKEAIK